MNIRDSRPEDTKAINTLYPLAFPDEDLRPLVHELLSAKNRIQSLVAFDEGQVVGHVVLSMCGIENTESKVALLGPLAVIPEKQRRGIGRALINACLERLRQERVARLCVLGDPVYYGRFGFQQERGIEPPYPLPDNWLTAWQSVDIGPIADIDGKLVVPDPWRHRSLWSP